ncbi:hypothetical protein ILUMI_18990 [Ignelater luminosus]|uniref:Uncharacterized protein n=1 Tax=Ignelater luminosus TaxID=2038154 RepID=A0A8K0CGZ7_IGNLU|nr:hypothetical protein ILUMI_18990 [Ignelater luminosus]
MNARRGCQSLKDLSNRFERVVNGGESEKVVVYFRDTATIQLVLVSLGVARDHNRLTAENYFSQTRRNWRTSTLTPFTANLVAVLHQCQQGEPYKVMFYLNESPLEVPGCQVGLCNWNIFKQKIEEITRNCDSEYCGGGAASLKGHVLFSLTVISLAVFYKLFF